MQAQLVTLSGGYNPMQVESMSGWYTDMKKGVSSATSYVTPDIIERNVPDFSANAILGTVITGNPTAGLALGFLATGDNDEYIYRPSKMKEWTPTAGIVLTAAGAVMLATPLAPAAPFVMAGGAALSATGAVTTAIHEENVAEREQKKYELNLKKAEIAQAEYKKAEAADLKKVAEQQMLTAQARQAASKKTSNTLLLGAAAVAAVTIYLSVS